MNLDEEDAGKLWGRKWNNKVLPFDSGEDGWDVYLKTHQPLGPRTAGDGSDNPDELAPVSSNNKFPSSQPTATSVSQSGPLNRERSGAIFKRYLDVQSGASQGNWPPGQSPTHPVPRSMSMEGIASAAPTSKFQFKPQKILEAAKRIGQGSQSGSMESLDVLPNEKEKKQGALKKLLKESSIPILGGNLKKKKAAVVGKEEAPSPITQPPKADEPCAFSEIDQPSSFDDRSLAEGAVTGSNLQCPLSDAILALLCELLKDRGSWLTVDHVQQGFSGTLGGLLEW